MSETVQEKVKNPNRPLYLRLKDDLKSRLLHQCFRLNLSQAGFTKQALVKLIEEEEQKEAEALRRKA